MSDASYHPSHPTQRRRGRRVVVSALTVLGAATLVVSLLTFQAFRAQQDQRAAVDRALKEYAGFAAWEYASNAKEQMWLAMTELLRPAEKLGPVRRDAQLPSTAFLVESEKRLKKCKDCAVSLPASYYFRVDLRNGELASEGKEWPSDMERRWLIDTVVQHAREVFERKWRVATIVGSPAGVRRTVAYTIVRDTTGGCIGAYGVVMESSRFMEAISRELGVWSLLPPSLLSKAGTERLVSVKVHDDGGHTVYRSPWQFPPRYSASVELVKFVAGFTVQASLDPVAAERLIPGADARRLPVLLTLLVITIALLGVAVRQLRREAALARLRSDFVSSVSHELRTPLAQIRMFAELLRMGWVRSEDERRRSLEIIDQESRRLAHLVDKVLRFEASERGETPLSTEPTVVATLVREVIEAFAPLAKSRDVRVSLALDETVVAVLDRSAIRQVLINLLDNAVKYGPVGQTVTVGVIARNTRVLLTVDDEGPGIPEAERVCVWEPFRRLERDSNSAVAGSGIGLSVVKKLVEGHDGRVYVEARTGGAVGARFVVDLPRVAAATLEHHEDGPRTSEPDRELVSMP